MSKVFKKIKKFGKKVGKVLKKVGKVIKKIAKPLAIGAALYFGGGALLGSMGSSWGSLGSSIMSGAGSAGKSLLSVGKSMLGGLSGGSGPHDRDMDKTGSSGGFNWGGAIMGGIDAYTSYQGGKSTRDAYNKAAEQANPFGKHRGFYGDKLRGLYDDPSSIADTPGYKFSLAQGEQAIGRLASATGGRLGGKRFGDTLKFSQGLASQMWQSETARLGGLAGSGFSGGQQLIPAGEEAYQGGLQDAFGTVGHSLGYG